MKRFYQWGLLLLMGVLLAGCSLVKDGLKELTNENLPKAENAERKKDLATDLLTQSKKEMEKMAGYRWESSGEQEMEMSGESDQLKTTFTYSIDYLDPQRYAMDMEMKVEAGNQRNTIDFKMIQDEDIAYFHEPFLDKWMKSEEIPEEIDTVMGMEYFDPAELIKMVSPYGEKLTVDEKNDHWQLTLNLKDHQEIEPLMEFAIENYKQDDEVNADEIVFSDLEMVFMINKADKQLTQVKQSIQIKMSTTSGEEVNLSQSWTNSFEGEVKELAIPEAAKNAPLIEE